MFTYHTIPTVTLSTIENCGGVFMDIPETLKIVRALANGLDPVSGKNLEENSTCRQPQVIKALNRAISALVQEKNASNASYQCFSFVDRTEDEKFVTKSAAE